eukprot:scaffold158_cov105-Cylindrotheca_fusiformis.AAC.13
MANPLTTTTITANDEDLWWKEVLLTLELSSSSLSLLDIPKIQAAQSLKQLHRSAYSLFVQGKMDHRSFFLICCLSWMESSCNWFVSSSSPSEMTTMEEMLQTLRASSSDSMVSWMLPSPFQQLEAISDATARNTTSAASADNEEEELNNKVNWLRFWLGYFDTCVQETDDRRPTKKRRKVHDRNSSSDPVGKYYQLPCAYYMIALLYQQQLWLRRQEEEETAGQGNSTIITISWKMLHDRVHESLGKYFKSFTFEQIRAALFLFGVDCLYSNNNNNNKAIIIPGLNPVMLLEDYIERFG